jgi:hypothetical protein
MKNMTMPPARPVLYPLRSRDSASVYTARHPRGRRRVMIDHQPLAVTPEQLLWWFRNIGGTMDYAGERMQNYLAWHPLDHIDWRLARPAPGGGADEGAQFRIIEAFQRNEDWFVDTTDNVEKLDLTGIRLVRRLVGVPVMMLEHTWSRCGERTHYVSVLDVGARGRLTSVLNRLLLRQLPDAMLDAWVTHNIEEVGVLEHLLPHLHGEMSAQRASGRAAEPAGR